MGLFKKPSKIKNFVENAEEQESRGVVYIDWVRRGPLTKSFNDELHKPKITSFDNIINQRVEETERIGQQPLWTGYKQKGATRDPSVVKTRQVTGRFYTDLIQKNRPEIVVEFGTAFGVSGMYWLSGLELNKKGHLHTFEVNKKWADVAEENLRSIGERYSLHRGLFEDKVEKALSGKKIDIAFIDGIHTSEWVFPQCEIVIKHLSKNGIIILDDIDFSEDMSKCWETLSNDPRVISSARVTKRVGILQLGL